MTNLEAITILSNGVLNEKDDNPKNNEAIELAITALNNIDRITAERDKAIEDLKNAVVYECGINQCYYCKYREEDGQCHHECIPYTKKWGWEWRGVQNDS